jgi:hypothetical protein
MSHDLASIRRASSASIRYDVDEAPAGSTAEERFAYAMAQVQGAQELLAAASRNLSPIIGSVPEWRRAGRLYDTVKTFWYRLDAKLSRRRGNMKLDRRW